MAETEKPLKKFIEIQDKQFKLDELKKKQKLINTEIRGLSQIIPKLIRDLSLK